MTDFRLRRATKGDRPHIRSLIWKVHINPFGLDWERFIVAVNGERGILGCGQLKPHGVGVIELASIAVTERSRGSGIARALIEHLLDAGTRPIYLVCLPELTAFYERFGFAAAPPGPLPLHFRRIARFGQVMRRLRRSRAPVVMKLE